MRFRSRMSENIVHLGVYQYYSLLGGGSRYNYSVARPKYEFCWDELHRGPPYHSGGPFYLCKGELSISPIQTHIGNPSHYWDGPFINASVPLNQTSEHMVNDFATVYGFDPRSISGPPSVPAASASLYRNASPLKPGVNLGQDIGEALVLKDIPTYPGASGVKHPERLKNAVYFAKQSGNEYLNLVFGWNPLLRDLNAFIKVTRNLDKRLRQLKRDNGRKVKRKLSFRSQSESTIHPTTEANFAYGYPLGIVDPGFFTGKGTRDRTDSQTTDIKFVGEFRYWIPDLPALPSGLRELAILYGLEPSPSLVWELTPWSWLLDWWSNVGDVLANVSSAVMDNLVSTFAYYMEHKKYSSVRVDTFKVDSGTVSLPATATHEIKSRWPASPYGFGLTSGDLSGTQMAILGALGLSKGL